MIQTSSITRPTETFPMAMGQESSGLLFEWEPRSRTPPVVFSPVSTYPHPDEILRALERWPKEVLLLLNVLPPLSSISTGSLTEEILRTVKRLEEDKVYLKDREGIQKYLLDFPGIMEVLPYAVLAVKRYIPEAKLILGIYRDPEIKDCYPVLCVRLESYDKSVIDRLEAAEVEFMDRLAGKEGWVQLTTDFEESGDAL